MPVFKEFAALFASTPLLAMMPIYRAASSTEYPAALNIGAATDIASESEFTSRAELLQAFAKTSA